MNEKEIIQNIKKSVKKTDPTAEVYLFGSRAILNIVSKKQKRLFKTQKRLFKTLNY
jgi:hypothetical protein